MSELTMSAFDFFGVLPPFRAAFVGEFLDLDGIFVRALSSVSDDVEHG